MKFKSSITKEFLGNIISSTDQVSREEAKSYLQNIEQYTAKALMTPIKCVITNYLTRGLKCSGHTSIHIQRMLESVHNDIKLMQQRLVETATPIQPKIASK